LRKPFQIPLTTPIAPNSLSCSVSNDDSKSKSSSSVSVKDLSLGDDVSGVNGSSPSLPPLPPLLLLLRQEKQSWINFF
jgi:hypothetical protein